MKHLNLQIKRTLITYILNGGFNYTNYAKGLIIVCEQFYIFRKKLMWFFKV